MEATGRCGEGRKKGPCSYMVSLKIAPVWNCVLRSCCSVGSLWHAQKYAKQRVQSSMVTFNSLQSVFSWSPSWRGGSWLPSGSTLSMIYSGNFSNLPKFLDMLSLVSQGVRWGISSQAWIPAALENALLVVRENEAAMAVWHIACKTVLCL